MKALLLTPLFLVLLAAPLNLMAQEEPSPFVPDTETLVKAKVIKVENQRTGEVPGTGLPAEAQTLTVTLLQGPDQGTNVTFDNDFTQLEVGDVFYARHIVSSTDGTDVWTVADPYRLPVLIALTAAFLILLFLFGGKQGVRGLATLLGSLVLIFYLLLPAIYNGHSPILVSIGVASLIIFIGSYVTHGVNRATTAAVIGMLATVIVTGAAAYWAVHVGQLSGFSSDANVYLNFNTNGRIDMVGLLFGGIMIGLLGVLYDIAIGQAVAIDELYRTSPALSVRDALKSGLRIGREHIGALVNTLAIAYVGASLPLFLLAQQSTAELSYILNGEVFATEIIRILVGSIGLILAVPITTAIAARLLKNAKRGPHEAPVHTHSH